MPVLKEPNETESKDRPSGNRPVRTNGSQKPEAGEMTRNAPLTPSLWATNPLTMMRRFTDEMDHLFAHFGFGHGLHMPSVFSRGRELLSRETGLVPADWSPQIDVLERSGQFVVHADLPGMSKDDR